MRAQPVCRRALALATALGCLWMSSIGSVFHTDTGWLAPAGITRYVSRPGGVAPAHAAFTHNSELRCAACEWQANAVAGAVSPESPSVLISAHRDSPAGNVGPISRIPLHRSSRSPPA